MIAYIAGELVERKPTSVVIDTGGVGYQLLIPTSTFEQLPANGKPVKLYTHHYVREDADTLFGFATDEEREVFEILISVSGVGPKLALAALSAMRPSELRQYVATSDITLLTRIPGVGRKTAERMIVELRDKLTPDVVPADTQEFASSSPSVPTARMDAIMALEALGVSRSGAEKSVAAVMHKNPTVVTAEELIRLALREQ